MPEGFRKSAEMYAGCVAGAIQMEEYLSIIHQTGFDNIKVQKQKRINLPDEILREYLSESEIAEFKNGKSGIESVTVTQKSLPKDYINTSSSAAGPPEARQLPSVYSSPH